MPRPKRPGGTFSTEWPSRLSAFFSQHKRLTKKGVALVLNDIAYEQGYKPISAHALYKYCSVGASRRPTDHFMACWEIFEARLKKLQQDSLAIRTSNGQHFVTIIDGEPETVWLPNGIFLKRCETCKVSFIGQWNAKRCPGCRLDKFSKNALRPIVEHLGSPIPNTARERQRT